MGKIYADIFFKENADIVDCLQLCKKLKNNRLIKNIFCSVTFDKSLETTTRIEIDEKVLTQPYLYIERSKKEKDILKRLAMVSLAGSKYEDIRKSALEYLAKSKNSIHKRKVKEVDAQQTEGIKHE